MTNCGKLMKRLEDASGIDSKQIYKWAKVLRDYE